MASKGELSAMAEPQRGEIWLAKLDDKPPAIGHEQAGSRPVLIFSVNRFNKSAAGLVIVLTLTSKGKAIPWHVEIKPPEAAINIDSYIMCESVRTIDKSRLKELWGTVSLSTLTKVEDLVKVLLGF
jgi:mRNA interferase MazF